MSDILILDFPGKWQKAQSTTKNLYTNIHFMNLNYVIYPVGNVIFVCFRVTSLHFISTNGLWE